MPSPRYASFDKQFYILPFYFILISVFPTYMPGHPKECENPLVLELPDVMSYHVSWESNQGSLEEHTVLLTTKSFLQPNTQNFSVNYMEYKKITSTHKFS